MAPPRDLREWIARLERDGELVRITAEVDPDLEITEINDRTVKAGGPALLFENVKGSDRPLLINQFGTERRMCLAFDSPSLDDVARKLEDVLEMQPPQGLVEKVRGLQKLKSIADSRPKTVRRAACQEIVLEGDDASLDALPIQKCWPDDAAPFITLPAVITKDPRTGTRNVGMYRMQKLGPRATAMHWQIHKDGRADYLATDRKIEVAVALGTDPVTTYTASAPLPKHIDELMLAGFLRGEPVELVHAKTVAVDVPANAEIILEGYIQKDELTDEGPFGDHTGYYTPAEPFPVFHLTAITMRRDAIYPSIVVGKPPQEDAWLGKATERIFLPAIKMTVPEIHDYEEVMFRVGANVDPQRDVLITEGPLDHLDHAPTRQFYGGKIGIDATHKGPQEGTREWPPEIEMSPEIKALVDRRWSEYGIPLDGGAGNGRIRQSSRP